MRNLHAQTVIAIAIVMIVASLSTSPALAQFGGLSNAAQRAQDELKRKQEAEAKAKQEAEAKAKKEAEDKAKKDAEAKQAPAAAPAGRLGPAPRARDRSRTRRLEQAHPQPRSQAVPAAGPLQTIIVDIRRFGSYVPTHPKRILKA